MLATLSKTVSFTNLSAAAIDFHLFDYTDFDIRFNALTQLDTARLVSPGRIITSSSSIPFSIDASAQVAADRYQISNFITPYFQFFIDQDGPTTLPNTPALGAEFPATPGDTAFAFQWSRMIAPGDSFTVGQVARYLPTSSVPEPANWAYFIAGFGLIGIAARRRTAKAA
ncbi:PEPxxWA-CTERM sorting domain-containing protein [Sandarakinorhabdus sp.]|uniref:PEPxxWA-CTERM sorting domain-containing protein n=1 Tax=Sandarakinorhabdus sp. TaxID=1916663 RepID=UPI00286D80D6|nr:PEPxxWA-CTERM sorting domain-containing protein [Sandarakinorhabdus sp.]